jgi:hypothetical protein
MPFSTKEVPPSPKKYSEAKLDGRGLLRSASDIQIWVQCVGIPIDQALNFSDGLKTILGGEVSRKTQTIRKTWLHSRWRIIASPSTVLG